MCTTRNVVSLLGCLFGLVTTVAPAAGGPLTFTFEGVGPGSGNAGQYNWNTGPITSAGILYTPLGNGSSSATHFVTFCIEQSQHISAGSAYDGYAFSNLEASPVPGPAMPPGAADAIRSMWAQYRAGLDTDAESAAFQHAIWHLVDPGYNPSLGGQLHTLYAAYLSPASWLSGLANLATITSGSRQDQVFELLPGYRVRDGEVVRLRDQVGNDVLIPAPAALIVGLLLAPALLWRVRSGR